MNHPTVLPPDQAEVGHALPSNYGVTNWNHMYPFHMMAGEREENPILKKRLRTAGDRGIEPLMQTLRDRKRDLTKEEKVKAMGPRQKA